MLDTETKRRIDTARDILVGKVPDPKSQVEQITIALIYKFMDDMDAEAEELGGQRTFFSGEFARFGWAQLMDVSLGGNETLMRYSEALEKMKENPNIPDLFRNIFRNVFLPYRDPETLKSFLKVINDFTYDHSERLGDAFEYLLSVMDSQGAAGQFRTPRHIIDFMVELIDPQKNDRVLDPACGTAGFLISAFKHILKTAREADQTLTPDEKTRLMQNFTGYDISPDMVRLSRVNLYLHGFQTPNIHEYDTLTSDERWNESADVILANPPFMSPSGGGIRPHKRFSVESNRSEVLFVDYIMEHLTVAGRAAVIVPEGIIFQSGKAYKALRKMLVENDYLVGVISLPAGVFNPYSGVKTSILWLDRSLAKKTDSIIFAKIESDGFDLRAQRKPNSKNELPKMLESLSLQKKQLFIESQNNNLILVPKVKISVSGEYNLSSDRYKVIPLNNKNYEFDELGQLCQFEYGKPLKEDNRVIGEYPVFGSNGVVGFHNEFIVESPFIVVGRKGSAGEVHFSKKNGYPIDTTFFIKQFNEQKIRLDYLFIILKSLNLKETNTQSGVPGLNRNDAYKIKIPVPPLENQQELVSEIESYQKIIDGARMIVENYRPRIEIDPSWENKNLGNISNFIDYRGISPRKTGNGVTLITAKNVRMGFIQKEPAEYIDDYDAWTTRGIPQKGDILFTTEAPLGNVAIIETEEKIAIGQRLIAIHCNPEIVESKYLGVALMSDQIQSEISKRSTGSTVKGILARYLKEIPIPIPPLNDQKMIVDGYEKEQMFIFNTKQIISHYEQKIRDRVSKIWGE